MLAAILCNVSRPDVFAEAAPGDYRSLSKKRRKPIEDVEEALAFAPEEAGELVRPFLVDATRPLASLVDFRRLLADMAAYQSLLNIIERRREEEEIALVLAMI